jgi:hypothetical protein
MTKILAIAEADCCKEDNETKYIATENGKYYAVYISYALYDVPPNEIEAFKNLDQDTDFDAGKFKIVECIKIDQKDFFDAYNNSQEKLKELNQRLIAFGKKCIDKIRSTNNEIIYRFKDNKDALYIVNYNKNQIEHLVHELKTLEKEIEND